MQKNNSGTASPNLGSIDTLGKMILSCEAAPCPVGCFSSLPGLYPRDGSNTPYPNLAQPKMSPDPVNVSEGQKSPPLRTTALE